MKPAYFTVLSNYYRPLDVKKPELFKEIGWDDLIDNATYYNTCAIRVSLALIKSGLFIHGRIAIKKGPHKGKLI